MAQFSIIYTGLGELELSLPARLSATHKILLQPWTGEAAQLHKSDLLLAGPATPQPASVARQAYSADKHLSVIVLCLPAQLQQIKQAIMFTPFSGPNVMCVPYHGNESSLAETLSQAATRTRQRRSFNKISYANVMAGMQPAPVIQPEQLGRFLHYAPIGAILVDAATERVAAANDKARELLGLDNGPSMQQLSELTDHITYTRLKSIVTDRLSGNATIETPSHILEVTSSEVTNEEGSSFIILFFTDVTAHRLEERKIRSVLEALPQMAWITDVHGITTFFTQGWYTYTGQQKDEPLGSGWQNTVAPEDLPGLVEQWQHSVKTQRKYQHAARFKNRDGQYRWHLIRAVPVYGNSHEVTMWVGTCTDVHDQVRHTEELEQKVRERTRLLEDRNSELEQYAHISSHDLQEPLRKINTFISLIRDRSPHGLDEEGQRYLNKIATTATRMTQILKDLLSYTRLGDRSEQYVPVDLNEIMAKVTEDLELLISQSGAKVQYAGLPVIEAIPVQMTQLFYNLINNALKFARPEMAPEVTISAAAPEQHELPADADTTEGWCKITVADNGIGFDQQYANQIFSVFKRLHIAGKYEGTGIGLAICRKIVANHHGSISVRSERGKGSNFTVILPRKAMAPPQT